MLKFMLVNTDFEARHLTGWQHSRLVMYALFKKTLMVRMEYQKNIFVNQIHRTVKYHKQTIIHMN